MLANVAAERPCRNPGQRLGARRTRLNRLSGNLLYPAIPLTHKANRTVRPVLPAIGSGWREGAQVFKDRDSYGPQHAPHGGAVALSHGQILAEAAPIRLVRFKSLGERYEQWRQHASIALSGIDFAPDLARDIGSGRWFRGVATLFGLAALAVAGWPDFAPLQAAPAMHIDDRARDEFRSQMIMPLALGGDSGRHMAPTAETIRQADAPERPQLNLVATLSSGDSFVRMLERAGVSGIEAGQVSDMIAGTMPLADIVPGTQVDITLGRRASPDLARPLDSLSFRARFDLQLAVDRVGGRLELDPHPIRVDSTPLRIRGTVGTSLYVSARAAGAPAGAVQQYLRALDQQMDLDDVSADDQFDMIVSYKRAATGEAQAGQLLYAGLSRGGKPLKQLLRWGQDGNFYETSGVGEMRQGFMRPVPGWETSGYGMRRHPILGYTRMHRGIDFHAPYGSPIYAAADGVVTFVGRHGGHGNFVKLDNGGGLGTGYAHMSGFAVSVGEHVRRGQVLGYVGSSGLATGPHLHFEVYQNGETVNPDSIQYVRRAQLSGSELAGFRNMLANLKQVEPGAALAPLAPDPSLADAPVREIDRADRKPAT
jgi:murein DD-endopeptidase MepM/ murein hydrolase activator NlpD